MYTPPFTVSAKAINLIAKITAQIERYSIQMEQGDSLRLRKANRVKTIHSSLAIECDTLTEGNIIWRRRSNGSVRDVHFSGGSFVA